MAQHLGTLTGRLIPTATAAEVQRRNRQFWQEVDYAEIEKRVAASWESSPAGRSALADEYAPVWRKQHPNIYVGTCEMCSKQVQPRDGIVCTLAGQAPVWKVFCGPHHRDVWHALQSSRAPDILKANPCREVALPSVRPASDAAAGAEYVLSAARRMGEAQRQNIEDCLRQLAAGEMCMVCGGKTVKSCVCDRCGLSLSTNAARRHPPDVYDASWPLAASPPDVHTPDRPQYRYWGLTSDEEAKQHPRLARTVFEEFADQAAGAAEAREHARAPKGFGPLHAPAPALAGPPARQPLSFGWHDQDDIAKPLAPSLAPLPAQALRQWPSRHPGMTWFLDDK